MLGEAGVCAGREVGTAPGCAEGRPPHAAIIECRTPISGVSFVRGRGRTVRILVTDKIVDEGIELLRGKGHQVDARYDMTPDELLAAAPDYDAFIVRSATQMTAEVIAAAKRCKIIGRAGVTCDNIDVDAATAHGIPVCNVPTSNIVSAAEHTMALMLSAAREIPAANDSLHAGLWKRDSFMGHELFEKTLAIFGLGRIGGLVAERARAFGMRVIGYDPYCSVARASQLGVTLYDTMDDVLPLADFITVHVPRTDETFHMFAAEQFAAMKDGVVLVNTARGGIIDEAAMADFMAAGRVYACGVDMLENEPSAASPLTEFDRAVLTPHLGANTEEAQMRAGVNIARYVANGLEGLVVPTIVNMVADDLADAVAQYIPACQMCGSMLAQLGGDVPKTLSIMAAGPCAGDLQALSAAALGGVLSRHGQASVSSENADASARRHGVKMEATTSADSRGYDSIVSMEADGLEISATVPGALNETHIVSILRYRLDIVPCDHALVFLYADKPGQIGRLGSVLGEEGVNISTMAVGTRPDCDESLAFLNVDGEVDSAVMRKAADAVGAVRAWSIRL